MSDEAPSEDPRLTAARRRLSAMEQERRDNQDKKEKMEVNMETMKESIKTAEAEEEDDEKKKRLMPLTRAAVDDHGRAIALLRYNNIALDQRISRISRFVAMRAEAYDEEGYPRDMDAAGQSGKSPKKKKGTKKKKKRKKRKGSKKKKKTVRRKKK